MANVIQDVITLIDQTSIGLVSSVYAELGTNLAPFLRNMFIVSIIIFGVLLMLGWVQYPISKLLKTIFKMVTIWTLLKSWAWFNVFFYQIFTNGPDTLGGYVLNAVSITGASSSSGVASLVGTLYEDGMITVGSIFANSGYGIGNYVIGLLLAIAILAVCGYALALIALAKVGMTAVLALAPIFIIFLMFESTKQMFSSWLQQLFNFSFVAILTYMIIAFFIKMLTTAVTLIPGDDVNFGDITPTLIVVVAAVFVLAQIMGIASGLAGGVQMSTMGAVANMSRAGNRRFSQMRNGGFGKGGGSTLLTKFLTRQNNIKRK